MKEVLISIKPRWCELIASKKKTVEVRKRRPKLETPFKVYIYCTQNKEKLIDVIHEGDEVYGFIHEGKPNFIKIPDENSTIYGMFKGGKIVGEFVCDKIYNITPHEDTQGYTNQYISDWEYGTANACLTFDEMNEYLKGKNGYGWRISDLKIYDKPRKLSEFSKYGFGHPVPLKRPPQSWMYVEAEAEKSLDDKRKEDEGK